MAVPRLLAVLTALAALTAPAAASADDELTGRLIVTRGADDRAQAVTPDAGESLKALAEELRDRDGVREVRAERRYALRAVPNDPLYARQEANGLTAQWYLERSRFPAAWDITDGEGATVAVIDTGVDASHPDLQGRVTGGADFDDQAGHGPPTTDENGHGTHVAGLACGRANNGFGIAGAGNSCTIIPVKSDLTETSIANSIRWAADNGADAISMSFGTTGQRPASQAVVDALGYAYAKGIVLVSAAADEPVEEQGDPSNVLQPTGTGGDLTRGIGLSVTAATPDGARASFAGLGTQISLAAYGAVPTDDPPGVLSTFPAGTVELERDGGLLGSPACRCRATFDGDNRFAHLQGTSMSTPQVAAAGALIRHLNPDLPIAQVLQLMKGSAARPAGTGWTPDTGWGVLNAAAALAGAQATDLRAPTSKVRRISPSGTSRGQRLTIRWTARDAAPAGVTLAGLQRVELWRSANGGRWRRVGASTKGALKVKLARGSRYGFATIAVDRKGNREALPARADSSVRIARRAR